MRPLHLARLLPLAALVACSGAPSRPPPPPRGPICAVPPRGSAPVEPGARAPGEAGTRPEALLSRARQLRTAGDHEGARQRLEQAARIAPDDPDVCFALADLLVADGVDLDRAAAMLSALPPSHPQRDVALGRLAEQRHEDAAAEAAYARQLARGPDPQVQLRRALALERLGRLSEAIAELERLRAASPGEIEVRLRLAEAYETTGRLGEAEAELSGLAEASPARPEGWRRLAAFCTRQGFTERARAAEARAHDAEAKPKRELRPLLPAAR